MSTRKHTPGPWQLMERNVVTTDPAPKDLYAPNILTAHAHDSANWRNNANRIVACVNACDGIEDPSVVPALIKDADALLTFLTNYPHQNTQDISGYVDALEKSLAKATGEKKS